MIRRLLSQILPPAPPDHSRTVERLEALERAVRDLKLDWEGTYEKFYTLTRRLERRTERAERTERAAEPQPEIRGTHDVLSRLRRRA